MSLKVSTCFIQRGAAPQWQFVNYFMQVPLNYVGVFAVGRILSSASRGGKLNVVEVKFLLSFCLMIGMRLGRGRGVMYAASVCL